MICEIDKLHLSFSGADSEEQSKPSVTIRSYTKSEAEALTGLTGRKMRPNTSKYPLCSFLACQLGRVITRADGETIFYLLGSGHTWGEAVYSLNK